MVGQSSQNPDASNSDLEFYSWWDEMGIGVIELKQIVSLGKRICLSMPTATSCQYNLVQIKQYEGKSGLCRSICQDVSSSVPSPRTITWLQTVHDNTAMKVSNLAPWIIFLSFNIFQEIHFFKSNSWIYFIRRIESQRYKAFDIYSLSVSLTFFLYLTFSHFHYIITYIYQVLYLHLHFVNLSMVIFLYLVHTCEKNLSKIILNSYHTCAFFQVSLIQQLQPLDFSVYWQYLQTLAVGTQDEIWTFNLQLTKSFNNYTLQSTGAWTPPVYNLILS